MLTKEQFDRWCLINQIDSKTRKLIEEIRSAPPERRVQSGIKNVPGFYPSKRMGVTIQFESHKVELPFIYQCEHSDENHEFYDQPPKIRFDYIGTTKKGEKKRKVFDSTIDFFYLNKDEAGWVECKPEEELLKLSQADPERYCMDENGQWRCPPGEAFAKKYGLQFRVFSSGQINWILQRNLIFLDSFFRKYSIVAPEKVNQLTPLIQKNPGMLLSELLEETEKLRVSVDDIYSMIAYGQLYIDLQKHIIAEPQYTPVFLDADTANAFTILNNEQSDNANTFKQVIVEVGKSVLWDGREWEIINHGTSLVVLRSRNDLVDFSHEQFELLVKRGKITGLDLRDAQPDVVKNKFLTADNKALRIATERFNIIKPHLDGENQQDHEIPSRTVRDWLSKYRNAFKAYGNGFIGLLPNDQNKGNHTSRLDSKLRELLDEWVLEKYETYKQPKIAEVYGDFLIECESRGIQGCSYKTFAKAIRKRPIHEQTKKRAGEKVAYKFELFYLEYHMTVSRHGDRPFEFGHIDHTELDIELIDSQTKKNLGRPWATFLTDGHSRRLLAVYLTFDPPSYRSCLMVLRECVKRHSRLPETVVVDGGKEFSSIYFETVLAAFASGKKQRPAGRPRFGSVLERLFGSTNTRFINNLTGNTQSTKNVRQLTKKITPRT